MRDDLLNQARHALDESENVEETGGVLEATHLAAWGTLAATIDGAETLRRIEGQLHARTEGPG